ncbi:hypothetical protein [Sorangium sp. So ce128]
MDGALVLGQLVQGLEEGKAPLLTLESVLRRLVGERGGVQPAEDHGR